MSVELNSIKAGACFRFKTAVRRVIKILKEEVHWEYADGVKRSGRRGGVQWIHYFRVEALEQVPDPALALSTIPLRTGENTPAHDEPIDIVLTTNAPGKWAFLDLASGEVWKHDGKSFQRVTGDSVVAIRNAIVCPSEFEAELLAALKADGRVAAVKLHRDRTGSSLPQAIAAIDALR